MLAFPSAPATRPLAWLRRASKSHPSSSVRKTQLTDFFQIPQNPQRTLPVHDVIYIPKSQFSIWDFYFDICERRANTCTQVCTQLTYAQSQKVLSLTKPKGKIYKTKSLGHYITLWLKKICLKITYI